MFLNFSKIPRWQKKFDAAYPFLEDGNADPQKLRLVLGVGRSGTSWVCQVLFKTMAKTRCFSEPLFHIAPKLPFHKEGDHTAIGYEAVDAQHPLARAYQLLTHPKYAGPEVKCMERNEAGWELCVVKEVHSLLGTEGILRLWKTPAVFILRDPVYVVDSLFAAQTLETIYIRHELIAVQQAQFLNRFAPGKQESVQRLFQEAGAREPRQKILLTRLITIQLMQEMFAALAREFPFTRLVQYEELCAAPGEKFPLLAEALSLPWDNAMADYLATTTAADSTSTDPYSVKRNTGEQKDRPFKFLTPDEAALCRDVLDALKGESVGAPV